MTYAERGEREGALDLRTFGSIVWAYRMLIAIITGVATVAAVAYALLATPIYRAEVVVVEVHEAGVGGLGGVASQLGGLASLAGINLSSDDAGEQRLAMLRSRWLVERFVERNRLTDALLTNAPKRTLWQAVEVFRGKVLQLHEDRVRRTTTLSMDWTDGATAARWANDFIALANEMIRDRARDEATRSIAFLNEQIAKTNVVEVQRVMYNLIESETKTLMLTNAKSEYAFTVVDPAVTPELRFSPKRRLVVSLALLAGLVLGVLTAFVHNTFGRKARVPSAAV